MNIMAAVKKKAAVRKPVTRKAPSRSYVTSRTPRRAADTSERKALDATAAARKKAASSRTNRTADKSERVLQNARNQKVYYYDDRGRKDPYRAGRGGSADTIAARSRTARRVKDANTWRQFEAGANKANNPMINGQDARYGTYNAIWNTPTGMRNTTRMADAAYKKMYDRDRALQTNLPNNYDKVQAAKKVAGAKKAAKKQNYR